MPGFFYHLLLLIDSKMSTRMIVINDKFKIAVLKSTSNGEKKQEREKKRD